MVKKPAFYLSLYFFFCAGCLVGWPWLSAHVLKNASRDQDELILLFIFLGLFLGVALLLNAVRERTGKGGGEGGTNDDGGSHHGGGGGGEGFGGFVGGESGGGGADGH